MSFWKKLTGIIMMCVVMISFAGCRKVVITTGETPELLFSVGEEECTMDEALIYLNTLKNEYTDLYGIDLWQMSDSAFEVDGNLSASSDAAAVSSDAVSYEEDLMKYIKEKTMYRLQHIYCMYLMAKEQGITLSESRLNAISGAAEEYVASLTDEDKAVVSLSVSDVEGYYEKYAYASAVFDSVTGEVDIEISDDVARVVEAQVIYTDDADKLSTISSLLQSGSDFATVASSYSSLSYITTYVARGDLSENLEEALFALAQGEVSDCITTDDGYYFVYCVNVMDEERTEANREKILEEAYEEAFDEKYDEFVKSLSFSINTEVWDNITLDDLTMETTNFFDTYNNYMTN